MLEPPNAPPCPSVFTGDSQEGGRRGLLDVFVVNFLLFRQCREEGGRRRRNFTVRFAPILFAADPREKGRKGRGEERKEQHPLLFHNGTPRKTRSGAAFPSWNRRTCSSSSLTSQWPRLLLKHASLCLPFQMQVPTLKKQKKTCLGSRPPHAALTPTSKPNKNPQKRNPPASCD